MEQGSRPPKINGYDNEEIMQMFYNTMEMKETPVEDISERF